MWLATYTGENENITIQNYYFKKGIENLVPDDLYTVLLSYRESGLAVFSLTWQDEVPEPSEDEIWNWLNAHMLILIILVVIFLLM